MENLGYIYLANASYNRQTDENFVILEWNLTSEMPRNW